MLEVFGCMNEETTLVQSIKLAYTPNIYPGYHSWETSDNGEISMAIKSEDDFFQYIGIQSVNLRTGEVKIHLFDELVYNVHGVARFEK